MIQQLARHCGFSLDTPLDKLAPDHKRALFYGTGDQWIPTTGGVQFQFKGIFTAIGEAARVSWVYRHRLTDVVGEQACPTCQGSRLRDDAAAVQFAGRTMAEWTALPLEECLDEVKKLKLSSNEKRIAGELLREIQNRLQFLVDVGLGYLTLARSSPTLSGGEAQRIRLASQLGSGLTGVLYLLDEPTIGLHPRDNTRLLQALKKLRDLGNTLILVEHDREVIAAADHLVDFGPGAGRFGGQVVASGPPTTIAKKRESLTGQYLAGTKAIAVPTNRRTGHGKCLSIIGAAHHNLRRIDVDIPLGTFTVVTGPSGSGKSSLVNDILWASLARRLHRAQTTPGLHEEIRGIELIDKVIQVDQQPLGTTPASSPATYTGVFDLMRDLFASLPESKVRGFQASRFSFNKPGGRCEVCEGVGQKRIEMHFLPDVWINCDTCKGERFNEETLAIRYRGKSIADVLRMTVAEALETFGEFSKIRKLLQTLVDVGLEYMPLGQSAPTLSGGEAQRVRLAAELARPSTGKTLYILDEPTTGLHFDDLKKLLEVLHRFVDLGNTVVVIEHNLDVIKTADWVIDMGPEAGDQGGTVVCAGTPEHLVDFEKKRTKRASVSHTAVALEPVLKAGPHQARIVFDPDQDSKNPLGKELHEVGDGVAMPWQVDGPRWHTLDRIAANGKKPQWEGSALAMVVEAIESTGEFGPTNWNDRRLVEIAAKTKSHGWFFHAHTGDEWLLWLKFRAGKGAFKQELLDRKLKLEPLDQLTEVPYYGKEPRVHIRKTRTLEQDITITVFRKEEIDTPAFREFLDKAVQSFLASLKAKREDPSAAEPWLADGKAWHESDQGFPSGRKVLWNRTLLKRVLGCVEDASPEGTWDWASRDSVKRRFAGIGQSWARIVTKQPRAIEINLVGPKGQYNLAHIDRFGSGHTLRTEHPEWDSIRFSFTSPDDFSSNSWTDFLAEHAEAFLETWGGE
jgi:excinuclease ABC subunit A